MNRGRWSISALLAISFTTQDTALANADGIGMQGEGDQTGRRFLAATHAEQPIPMPLLPLLENPYAEDDKGGRLTIYVSPAADAGTSNASQLLTTRVKRATTKDFAPASVPVRLPALPPPPTTPALSIVALRTAPLLSATPTLQPAPSGPAALQAPSRSVALATLLSEIKTELIWGAVGVGLISIFLLALLRLRLRRPKPPNQEKDIPADETAQAYAYLELQDRIHTFYPILRSTFRIGRHFDNDLALQNASISRHHAEIRQHPDGTVTITDLDSLNGILVNAERVKTATLEEGDLVELGYIGLRFTYYPEDSLSGDETKLMKTRTRRLSL